MEIKTVEKFNIPKDNLLDNTDFVTRNISEMSIGERIRYCRVINSLTQIELGNMLDMDGTQICMYENGKSINLDTINRIAEALKVNTVELAQVNFFRPKSSNITTEEINFLNRMSTGEKISYFRKKEGLTQKQFAEKVGIHPVSIGQYERNKAIPKIENANKIAKALDVSTEILLGYNFYKYKKIPEFQELPLNLKIKWSRIVLNVKVEDFYDIVGMYAPEIKGIEHKEIKPLVSTINKIAEALNVKAEIYTNDAIKENKNNILAQLNDWQNMSLRQKMRYIRKKQNRSQQLLSEIAGVSKSAISCYECEYNTCYKLDIINKVSNALEIDLKYLIYLFEPKDKTIEGR